MSDYPTIVCCRACYAAELERVPVSMRGFSGPFIVCADCGNKRCPRATSHLHSCTRSNEPGQKGSAYE